MIKYSNNIKEIRKEKKLTLAMVAERAGTSFQQIARLEKGERELTLDWMVRIAEALECHPIDLLPDAIGLSRRERVMVSMFQNLSPRDQEQLMKLCDALSQPVSDRKGNDE